MSTNPKRQNAALAAAEAYDRLYAAAAQAARREVELFDEAVRLKSEAARRARDEDKKPNR